MSAEKSRKTPREHLAFLRVFVQDLGTKASQGEPINDDDLKRAVFLVDTVVESLPPDPAPVQQTAPPPAQDAETVRTDGPTLEQYVDAGYKAENYPPEGYAERDSPGLRKFRARQAWDAWVAGGKVGPAPGPAPEEESKDATTEPAADGSQPNAASTTEPAVS